MKYIRTDLSSNRKDSGIILLLAAVCAGIAAGSVIRTSLGSCSSPLLHQYFLPPESGYPVTKIFGQTLLSAVVFLVLDFSAGLSVSGLAAAPLMLIWRAAGVGFSVASMYSERGIKALLPVLILVLPYSLCSAAVSVLASREAFRFSARLASFAAYGRIYDDECHQFRSYCIKFLVLLLMSVLSSAVCMAADYLFEGLRQV